MATIHINVRKVATFLQLGLVSVIIYYGMKLVIDSLDTTRKRPGQLTQKEVEILAKFLLQIHYWFLRTSSKKV